MGQFPHINTETLLTIHNRADLSISLEDDLENLIAKWGGAAFLHHGRVICV
jgi:hypothetical protein